MSPDVEVATWTRVLDELEEELEVVAAALDAGEPVPASTWTPPQGLGVPPEPLRGRLGALARQLATLQDRAQRRLAELGDDLAAVDRRRQAGAAYGAGQARSA